MMPISTVTLGVARALAVACGLLLVSGAGLARGVATRGIQVITFRDDTSFAGTVARLSEAAGLLRFRQPHLERDVVPARGQPPACHRRHGRRVHRRRPRPELLVHRGHQARGRVHDRHPARQPAHAPDVQGAVPAIEQPARVSQPVDRARGSRRRRVLGRCSDRRTSSRSSTAWRRHDRQRNRLAARHRLRRYGVPLSLADTANIRRFHGEFVRYGLDLRFTSTGRSPRYYYPTLRELILERDLDGRQASYLASENGLAVREGPRGQEPRHSCRGQPRGHRRVPGHRARSRRARRAVSALYVSNVEMYIWRDGSLQRSRNTPPGFRARSAR